MRNWVTATQLKPVVATPSKTNVAVACLVTHPTQSSSALANTNVSELMDNYYSTLGCVAKPQAQVVGYS